MTPNEHYRAAESILDDLNSRDRVAYDFAAVQASIAQAHATLALFDSGRAKVLHHQFVKEAR